MSGKILMDTERKNSKTVIIFDDIVIEKNIPSEVTELFIRDREVNSFFVIILNSALWVSPT